MRNIAENVNELDNFARNFWSSNDHFEKQYRKKETNYYATTTSYNWFGFLEIINEVIENPTWTQINEFVEYYCKQRKVDFTSYISLYKEIEKKGFTPVFKTDIMKEFYKNREDDVKLYGIYNEIYVFFNK